MKYRVELTALADRDLRQIYRAINAGSSGQAQAWFNGMEAAILHLDQYPSRAATTPEDGRFRHLLYGNKPHIYRIIFAIDEIERVVTVLHIRHGARQAFTSLPK